ncbi:MAG: hypothetical protein H0U74_06320 [Bradymonadaceae bacterium]|nr:hypothetical protein [Lujinxingiaceae bacterium]
MSACTRYAITLAVTLALIGCTRENPAYNPDPLLPDQCREGQEVSESFESYERPDLLDVLLVVDNSGDVEAQQLSLARAMPQLLEPLAQEQINVRVGVMTTDATVAAGLAPPGKSAPNCATNTANVADSEAQENWIQVAACNIQQGKNGDSFQRALEVIERAVISEPSSLSTFRRPRARLLIIVVSNEDDCSQQEPLVASGDVLVRNLCSWNPDKLIDTRAWAERLRAKAKSPEGIALATIAGPTSSVPIEDGRDVRPLCQSSMGAAYPSNRLYEVTNYFGTNGHYDNICSHDLSQQMREIARHLALASTVTLCPGRQLTHEPLAVQARTGAERVDIGLGAHGVVFLGRNEACPNGALSLNAQALRGVNSVESQYCVIP